MVIVIEEAGLGVFKTDGLGRDRVWLVRGRRPAKLEARGGIRVRAREELLFEVGVQNLTDQGGEFVFKVSRMFDASVVAYAVMGFVAYDYRQGKPIALSAALKEVLDVKPFEI